MLLTLFVHKVLYLKWRSKEYSSHIWSLRLLNNCPWFCCFYYLVLLLKFHWKVQRWTHINYPKFWLKKAKDYIELWKVQTFRRGTGDGTVISYFSVSASFLLRILSSYARNLDMKLFFSFFEVEDLTLEPEY